MKKLLVSILAVLYISITSGVVVNVHYCMGQLAGVNYGADDHEACGKCGMTEKKGCCHTDQKIVKLQDAHQLVKVQVQLSHTPAQLPSPSFAFNTALLQLRPALARQYHSPPDEREHARYLYNCVFRI